MYGPTLGQVVSATVVIGVFGYGIIRVVEWLISHISISWV